MNDSRWRSPGFFFSRILPLLVILTALAVLFADYPLADFVRKEVGERGKRFFWFLGRAGRGEYWAVLAVLMILVPWLIKLNLGKWSARLHYWQSGGIYMGLTIAVSTLIVQLIKYGVGRPRPNFAFKTSNFMLDPFTISPSYASFPSGHSQTAWAAALSLALLFPRYRIPLCIIAFLASLSRIGTNRHYLSDTLAGFTIALGCALVFYAIVDRKIGFNRPDESGGQTLKPS